MIFSPETQRRRAPGCRPCTNQASAIAPPSDRWDSDVGWEGANAAIGGPIMRSVCMLASQAKGVTLEAKVRASIDMRGHERLEVPSCKLGEGPRWPRACHRDANTSGNGAQ